MKYCPNCSAENDNVLLFCTQCGTSLPQPTKKSGKTAGKRAAVMIAVVCAVLAVIALVTGLLTSPKVMPEFSLGCSFSKSLKAFEQQMDENTNIPEAMRIVEKQLKKGAYSMELEFSDKDSEQFVFQTNYNLSRNRKLLSGSATLYSIDLGLDTAFDFAVNRKTIQLAFSNSSFNVYGFRFKDLNQKYSASYLKNLLPISIPEELSFKSFELKNILPLFNGETGDRLNKLKETLSVEYLGKHPLQIEGETLKCGSYRVTWSIKAAAEFLQTLSDTNNPDGSELPFSELLEKLEPSCICYVNKSGEVIGIDFMAAGNQYRFLLTGNENIWDSCVLTKTTGYGTSLSIPGGIRKDAAGTEWYLGDKSQEILSFTFTDAEKAFYLDVGGIRLCCGNLWAAGEGVLLDISIMPDTSGESLFELKLTSPIGKPEMLSENYIDIFNLNLDSIQRLLLDIGLALSNNEAK